MIKAIVFDYFGVVCSDEYWQFVKRDKNVESVFQEYAQEVNLGEISWQKFVGQIAEATGRPVEEVTAMYASARLNPLVVGLIAELHDKYKTGLLTNAHHDFIDPMLHDHHLENIFDVVAVSSRLGVVKPDPRIFEYMLEKLDVTPDAVIYIDDIERHVLAAKELGMQSILYENFPSLKRQLDAILHQL